MLGSLGLGKISGWCAGGSDPKGGDSKKTSTAAEDSPKIYPALSISESNLAGVEMPSMPNHYFQTSNEHSRTCSDDENDDEKEGCDHGSDTQVEKIKGRSKSLPTGNYDLENSRPASLSQTQPISFFAKAYWVVTNIVPYICTALGAYGLYAQVPEDSHWAEGGENSTDQKIIDFGTIVLAGCTGFFAGRCLDKTANYLLPESLVVKKIKQYKYVSVPLEYAIPAIVASIGHTQRTNLVLYTWYCIRFGNFLDDYSGRVILFVSTCKQRGVPANDVPLRKPSHSPSYSTKDEKMLAEGLEVSTNNIYLEETSYLYGQCLFFTGVGITCLALDLTLSESIPNPVVRILTRCFLQSGAFMSIGFVPGRIYGRRSPKSHDEACYYLPSFSSPVVSPVQLDNINDISVYLFHSILLFLGGFVLGYQSSYLEKKDHKEHIAIQSRIDLIKDLAQKYPEFFVKLRAELENFHERNNVSDKSKVPQIIKYGFFALASIIGISAIALSPEKEFSRKIITALERVSGSIIYPISYFLTKKSRTSSFHNDAGNIINDLLNKNLLPLIACWSISNKLALQYPRPLVIQLDDPLLYGIRSISSFSWALFTGSFMADVLEGGVRHSADQFSDPLIQKVVGNLNGKYGQVKIDGNRLILLRRALMRTLDSSNNVSSRPIKKEAAKTLKFALEEVVTILAAIADLPNKGSGEEESRVLSSINITILPEEIRNEENDIKLRAVKATMLVSMVLGQLFLWDYRYKIGL
jgi:hypothetical protein